MMPAAATRVSARDVFCRVRGALDFGQGSARPTHHNRGSR